MCAFFRMSAPTSRGDVTRGALLVTTHMECKVESKAWISPEHRSQNGTWTMILIFPLISLWEPLRVHSLEVRCIHKHWSRSTGTLWGKPAKSPTSTRRLIMSSHISQLWLVCITQCKLGCITQCKLGFQNSVFHRAKNNTYRMQQTYQTQGHS